MTAKIVIPFWKTASFWKKVKDSIALVGTGGNLTLLIAEKGDVIELNTNVNLWILVATFLGYLLGIWMVDANNNEIVDAFENKEIITVETTIEKAPGGEAKVVDMNVKTEPKEGN